ncbi:hypothetical protein HK096_009471 [Nowakowskiella sp. JEL0078]|nr:hypothetical protein HK096_009471 [Nowakowskiella sp. JEL0078]
MTEVISFLNGNFKHDNYTILGCVIRYVGVFGISIAGFFTGFDGPFAQIVSFDIINPNHHGEAKKNTSQNLFSNDLLRHRLGWKSLLSSLEARKLRLYATLGASVAITAIFRSPIGGVMFALEETTSYLDLPTLWRTLFSTVLTYLIVSYQIVKSTGSSDEIDLKKHFDPAQAIHFPVNTQCSRPIPYQDFFAYAFMAVIAALIGQLWNFILCKVQKLRLQYVICSHDKNGKHITHKPVKKFLIGGVRLLEVVVVCLITTIITVGIPLIPSLDDCTSVFIPTSHAAPFLPNCQTLANVSDLQYCTFELSSSCLPTQMINLWEEQFTNLYSGNNTLSRSTLQSVHRRRSIENSNFELQRRSEGKVDQSQANALSAAIVKLVANDPTKKNIPFYSFVNDQLKGDIQKGCYYQLKSLLVKSPEQHLKLILKRGLFGLWSVKTLWIFLGIYFIMSSITYYIALPTDLVVPNLVIGAICGRLFGIMSNYFKDRLGQTLEDPGAWALLGMAAAWSGTSRLTLTVVVIALELTGDFQSIPGLLVVTIIAASIGRFLGPSLYHVELENNGIPFLEHDAAHEMHSESVGDIIKDHGEIFTLNKIENVDRIREAVNTSFGSFPVVTTIQREGETLLFPVGLVLWERISEALNDGKLTKGTGVNLEENFPVEDLMNWSPYMVNDTASVAKVHKIMRSLGLKTILVIGHDDGTLKGILTRKDMIRHERMLHEHHGKSHHQDKVAIDDERTQHGESIQMQRV